MKRIIGLLLMLGGVSLMAQFKTEKKPVDVMGGITAPVPGSLLGFLSPDRFAMQQSYALTYSSGGGANGTFGMYTNSMNFRISDPLVFRVNMGILHQPFGGPKKYLDNQNAQILHGAELIYRPSRNLQMQVGYTSMPYYNGYGLMGGGPYYRPGSNANLFSDYGFMSR